MTVYRVASPQFGGTAETAFSGEGAFQHAGRWNPAGVRLVYTSTTLELAMLEQLVHVEVGVPPVSLYYTMTLDPAEVEELTPEELPADWNVHPPRNGSREKGREFCTDRRFLALSVPSVVVPVSRNILVNPSHPRFRLTDVEGPFVIAADPRLRELERRPAGGSPQA